MKNFIYLIFLTPLISPSLNAVIFSNYGTSATPCSKDLEKIAKMLSSQTARRQLVTLDEGLTNANADERSAFSRFVYQDEVDRMTLLDLENARDHAKKLYLAAQKTPNKEIQRQLTATMSHLSDEIAKKNQGRVVLQGDKPVGQSPIRSVTLPGPTNEPFSSSIQSAVTKELPKSENGLQENQIISELRPLIEFRNNPRISKKELQQVDARISQLFENVPTSFSQRDADNLLSFVKGNADKLPPASVKQAEIRYSRATRNIKDRHLDEVFSASLKNATPEERASLATLKKFTDPTFKTGSLSIRELEDATALIKKVEKASSGNNRVTLANVSQSVDKLREVKLAQSADLISKLNLNAPIVEEALAADGSSNILKEVMSLINQRENNPNFSQEHLPLINQRIAKLLKDAPHASGEKERKTIAEKIMKILDTDSARKFFSNGELALLEARAKKADPSVVASAQAQKPAAAAKPASGAKPADAKKGSLVKKAVATAVALTGVQAGSALLISGGTPAEDIENYQSVADAEGSADHQVASIVPEEKPIQVAGTPPHRRSHSRKQLQPRLQAP